jgi:hypothetical protein
MSRAMFHILGPSWTALSTLIHNSQGVPSDAFAPYVILAGAPDSLLRCRPSEQIGL